MLNTLEQIFKTGQIRTGNGDETIQVHSHTSEQQGLFLQKMFDIAKPFNSLEVGFAYGISTMFILEKHREHLSKEGAHIVIEPDDYWGDTAMHNLRREGLEKYIDVRRDYSDRILPALYHQRHKLQYAYVDTTKRFDIVFQDFYFIDKMLDINGIVILDDCGGSWPGVQKAARYINSLPNYTVAGVHGEVAHGFKRKIAETVLSALISVLPFKKKIFPGTDFRTDKQLGLNFNCIAFKKIAADERGWDFDKKF